MRWLIARTLERSILFPFSEGQVRPPGSYQALVDLISRINEKPGTSRCALITFNYDIALDHALYFNGFGIDYCLDGRRPDAGIPLLKLHGSLNWGSCAQCNQAVPWHLAEYFRPVRSWAPDSREVRLDLASQLAQSGLKHCDQPIRAEPVLVPPTWNKTDYSESLGNVWKTAAAELSTAENVFVMGYSLPETDSFFRFLFALGAAGEPLINRFWVFDPDPSDMVRPRYEKLLGMAAKARFRFERKLFPVAVEVLNSKLSGSGALPHS